MCIVSDSGTQFTSQEFKYFTRRWDIQHRITSPTNAHSNGQAECFFSAQTNKMFVVCGFGSAFILSEVHVVVTAMHVSRQVLLCTSARGYKQ